MTPEPGWTVFTLLACACMLGLVLCLYGEFRESIPYTFSGKLLAASTYLAAALALGAAYGNYGRWLLGGMLFCWVGDLLLVSRRSQGMFKAGLAAFLAGHVFYILAFHARGIDMFAMTWGVTLMALFAWRVVVWLAPHLDSRMRLPVWAYVVIISAMMAAAIGTHAYKSGLALLLGSALFVLSDLAVARNRFVIPGLSNRVIGLPLYFSAQFLLAASTVN